MLTSMVRGVGRLAALASLFVASSCGEPCYSVRVVYDGPARGTLWMQFRSIGLEHPHVAARVNPDARYPFDYYSPSGGFQAYCHGEFQRLQFWIDTDGDDDAICNNPDLTIQHRCAPDPGEPQAEVPYPPPGGTYPIVVQLRVP